MDVAEVLHELEALGTAQNRKVYARHGVQGPAFGVSYANLGKLVKRIGVDHELAPGLWNSGNHDARVLATKVADPGVLTAKLVDAWVKDLGDYVLTDAFSAMVASSPLAARRVDRWIAAKGEWVASAGWTVLGLRALHAPADALDDGKLATYVAMIEADIHGAKNRVRHAMNQALLSIGLRNPALRKRAVAAARRIGEVVVDHGQTGCKTPPAEAYISRTLTHRKAVAARRTSRAGR